MPIGVLLGVAFLLLLVNAFLSMGEAALLSFSRIRRRHLEEEDHPRIASVERILDSPKQFVLTIVTLNRFAQVGAAVAVALAALEWASDVGSNPALTVAGAALLTGVVLMAFGFVLPKAVGVRRQEPLALGLAPLFLALVVITRPLTFVLDKVSGRALAIRGPSGDEHDHLRSEEELKTLITLGTDEGYLEEEEEEMIQSVIEFTETTTKEVMVPRADVAGVPADATLDQVKSFILDSGFSRVPVYRGSLDNVVGVVYVKEFLLRLLDGKGQMQVKDIMRDPFFVPETKRISDLLKEMQARRVHFAVAIDEYGTTAGVVTLEDILEEIVGEIFDEEDRQPDPIWRVDAATAVVDARTHVSDVNDELDLELPEDGPYDTIGGFVIHQLGRLGKEGETVTHDGVRLVVEKASARRILRVRLVKEPPEGGPERVKDQ